jgi:hypothetical protein
MIQALALVWVRLKSLLLRNSFDRHAIWPSDGDNVSHRGTTAELARIQNEWNLVSLVGVAEFSRSAQVIKISNTLFFALFRMRNYVVETRKPAVVYLEETHARC